MTEPVNEKNELTKADLIRLLVIGIRDDAVFFNDPETHRRWEAALKRLTHEEAGT